MKPVKFMPPKPTINEIGKKIVEMIVRRFITVLRLLLTLLR
jgi:hypothetical protein